MIIIINLPLILYSYIIKLRGKNTYINEDFKSGKITIKKKKKYTKEKKIYLFKKS